MTLREIFLKQGGIELIKQYAKNGSLGTAICEFLLLGKSRTALEILRLTTQLKIKQKLEKRFIWCLEEFDKSYTHSLVHECSNKVWICWFQGLEKAPVLVKKCYESVKKNLTDREIIFITSENMGQYVQFPDFILEKWKDGIISHTHMTDLLRLELLIKYGGMWLDATVFCSGGNIPKYFFDSDLFLFQCLKPGRDGHSLINSTWLISAKTNNRILMAVQRLCYAYWKDSTNMDDYYLLHFFIAIAAERYKEEWNKIIPMDNATPHILLLRLFEKYDDAIWNEIKNQTPFHKLTYKFTGIDSKKQNTYYRYLFNPTENSI